MSFVHSFVQPVKRDALKEKDRGDANLVPLSNPKCLNKTRNRVGGAGGGREVASFLARSSCHYLQLGTDLQKPFKGFGECGYVYFAKLQNTQATYLHLIGSHKS